MSFTAERIPYSQTRSFSGIVLDYLSDAAALKPFYNYRPDIEGIKKAVAERKNFPVNRPLLKAVLDKQYAGMELSPKLKANIDSMLSEDAFTICTAHQPNIFTGHLYFIYKILHAVKLSDELNSTIKDKKFIPVFYMGSEDADLEELGELNINGTRYQWQTDQKGAVGRMKIDTAFLKIMEQIEGRLVVDPFGPTIMDAVRRAYTEGRTVEEATFHFVHGLFNEFGLVILLPDNRELKKVFAPVIKKELYEQFSHTEVNRTVAVFPAEYKVQATGRDINLFYLDNDLRKRIEKRDNKFYVSNTDLVFTATELPGLTETAAEKFSPNVILRPVFQEMILPDIAFIGGGGELAYWLELKNVFDAAGAFFPVLLLRNSFSVVNKNMGNILNKLSLGIEDIFKPEKSLLEGLVKKESKLQLDLQKEKELLKAAYEPVKAVASAADPTLTAHVHALRTQALHRLDILEKKMLKAEKKNFEAQQRQTHKFKSMLFPGGILQERVDNVLGYISIYGADFLKAVYQYSPAFSEGFTVLSEQ